MALLLMLQIKDLNINAKLTLLTVTTTVIALVCVVIAFVVQDLRLVKQVKSEQVESQLSMLSSNIAYALARSDVHAVSNLLNNTSTTHGVVSAVVFDDQENLLAQHPDPHPEIVEQSAPNFENRRIFGFSTRIFERPIYWQNQRVGRLEVAVSYADVQKRILYMLGYSLLAFLFATAIALVVTGLVQRIVSTPLQNLARLAKKVMQTGNYTLRTQPQGSDELGQLGQAINEMLDQIEQRDAMLEKQVAKRTDELQRLADEFRYRALHDSLTGLPNRSLLNEEFQRASAHANRANRLFALLLLDLDNFKAINDTHGHDTGDELLKCIATRLRRVLRGEDMICRLGGDEFVVLLEDVQTQEHLFAVAESLLEGLREPVEIAGHRLQVSGSIGASIYPQHGANMDQLKHHADLAMYQAKARGKHQLVIFEPSMAQVSQYQSLVQHDLQRALREGEVELYFQPQVNLQNNSLVGCEALVRWRHPDLGILLPKDFIAFAEDMGSVVEVDQFVLAGGCEFCQRWRREYALNVPVAINISAAYFHSANLLVDIRSALQSSGLPAEHLTLELSAASLVPLYRGEATVRAIQALGVRVALDGFELSPEALQCFGAVPFDSVKLDRKVFTGDGVEPGRLTSGLLAMAREMGVAVIADGVESPEQLAHLLAQGCQTGQGFIYAPAMPQEQFLHWAQAFYSARSIHRAHSDLVLG